MTEPNHKLRAVRMGMLLSQDDLARELRAAGARCGVPNDASKRLVQRWEAGVIVAPRPAYARALEQVTGLPIAALGFALTAPGVRVSDDGAGGHDVELGGGAVPGMPGAPVPQPVAGGTYAGVWLSRYVYHSSGRAETHTGLHHVVILQHGPRLTVRSLPGSADSALSMDLSVDGLVLTGTWTEQTAVDGYYRGARYHGAVQLLAEPTGRRMTGKWLGFGKQLEINSGPWELTFLDGSTGKAALDRLNTRPAADPASVEVRRPADGVPEVPSNLVTSPRDEGGCPRRSRPMAWTGRYGTARRIRPYDPPARASKGSRVHPAVRANAD